MAQPHPGILKLPPVALAFTGATAGAVGSPDKAQPHPGIKLPGAGAYRGYGRCGW
jgi:hypothetical protein